MTNGWYWTKTERGLVDWKGGRGSTFRSSLFRGLIREVIQNSKDWPVNRELNESGASPVKMEFELVELNRSQIPGIDENLVNQLNRCLEKAKSDGNREDAEGIQQAIKSLKKNTILCLHVSDTNTTGMSATLDKFYDESPFGIYMICESSKQNDRGGSHGQGKYAPLMSSVPRTIFVASVDKNGRRTYGGRCLFSSVKDRETGQVEEPDGYWGAGNSVLPITEVPAAYKWLERTEQGTSIWIIGLTEMFRKDFAYRAAAIASASYFSAIHQNRLELVFKDLSNPEIAVNKGNVELILNEPRIHQLISENEDDDYEPSAKELKNSNWYFKAYTGKSEGHVFVDRVFLGNGLGYAKIHLLLEDGAPRGCLYLRKDMTILDTNLRSQNENSLFMVRMSDCRTWCAVVEFEDPKTNAFIRSMEPPAHDTINSKELLSRVGSDSSRKNQIERDVRAIRTSIRDFIRGKAEIEVEESETIDWMNPKGAPGSNQNGSNQFSSFDKNAKRSFVGVGVHEPEPIKIDPLVVPAPPPNPNPKPNPNPNPKPRPRRPLDGPDFRHKFHAGEANLAFYVRSQLSDSLHRLTIHLAEVCSGTLYIMQVGGDLSANKQLKVAETNFGEVSKDGGVRISDVKDGHFSIDVKFAESLLDGSTIFSWVPDKEEEEQD